MAGQVGAVGFVGLGNAGWPMAEHLVGAGFELLVHDADGERAARFAAERGCRAAGSPRELAGVSTLFTMLPDGNVVRGFLLGPERLAEALAPGTVVVDTSSSDPEGTRALAGELAERGVVLIDSAVSVPEVHGAQSGRITFMVGTDDEQALERVRPLLEAMSESIFFLGGSGAGHTMKTLNNYISAAGLHAALDALMIGFEYGLDPTAMIDVLNVSTGRNWSTQNTLKYHSLPRDFNTGYTLALLVKDLRIARRFAARSRFESPLLELLERQYADALEGLGGGNVDHLAALRHWERRAGVQVAPDLE